MYEIKDKSKLSTALHIVDEFIISIFFHICICTAPTRLHPITAATTTTVTFLCVACVCVCVCVQANKIKRITPVYNLLLLYAECKKNFRHKK